MRKTCSINKTRSRIINIVYCTLLLSLLLLPGISFAEDIIKVIMLGSPKDTLPSEQAEKVEGLAGKVFINGEFHTGSLEVIRDANGLYVIKNLPLENYIENVVVSETKKDWEVEALKARAVISRTYATFYKTNNSREKYHISSSLPHLLYKGENEDPLVSYAVRETKGEILTYEGLSITALFHITGKGETESLSGINRGALEMARDGKDYKEILEYYYPGTIIQDSREFYSRLNEQTTNHIRNN